MVYTRHATLRRLQPARCCHTNSLFVYRSASAARIRLVNRYINTSHVRIQREYVFFVLIDRLRHLARGATAEASVDYGYTAMSSNQ